MDGVSAGGPRTAVVVPTLGERPEFLEQSLASIRAAGDDALVVIVAPARFDASDLIGRGLADQKLDETGRSLPAAIEQGFAALPDSVRFIAWLGDDDLLRPGALKLTADFLEDHPKSSAVYGRCDYIDGEDRLRWTNKSGPWAAPLLRVGPDLIPQPGSLFRRAAYLRTSGLRQDLGWAFDFDLFLKLGKQGKLSYLPHTLAAFRWHDESLSVGQREQSVREASRVRREHLPRWLRPVSILWEGPVRLATLHGWKLVGGSRQPS